jgi:uncharacterized protein (TIGR03083 family)
VDATRTPRRVTPLDHQGSLCVVSDEVVGPSAMPSVDVNPILGAERQALLDVLSTLTPGEWAAPTECPEWTVQGVALHVLGDDLSLLARQRDQVVQGLILYGRSHPDLDFRQLLDGFNEQWVIAATFLSPRLIIELLEMSGRETGVFYRDVDPGRLGEPVGLFAGTDASPYWQIAAREYLERWTHQQQIRRALGRPDLGRDFLAVAGAVVAHVLAAHARLLAMELGTTVVFEIRDVGIWTVQVDPTGSVVFEGAVSSPDVTLGLDADAATLVLSRGLPASEVPPKLHATGSKQLGAALVQGFAALAGRS